ncbi:MAG: cbb3-type cytochrome c oxidase subunit I [Magnetococcales bacterium]|nr:cbb3-type cytochrome c oxidase subunit I [Magnetococcales bacterium]
MPENQLQLTFPSGPVRKLATGWLTLALLSLVGSGLVVLLVILARVPVIHDLIPWTGSFKTALVIHVDLSVLVWFLSFAGLMGTLSLSHRAIQLGRASLATAAVGAFLIAFSPFLGEDAPFLNNYVPILANNAFFLGLTLFSLGFFAVALTTLFFRREATGEGEKKLDFGLVSAMVIAFFALASLLWSYLAIPESLSLLKEERYYELLFWGPGHILQFTHTQLLMVAWFWLATATGSRKVAPLNLIIPLFALGALPALLGPLIHLIYDIDAIEHRTAFTDLMYWGGGPAALIAGLWVFRSQWNIQTTQDKTRPQRLALLYSLVLFGAGGWIGFMIDGVNTIIPAHYHGSIVSVTLAYMGLTYHILPGLGFRRPAPNWSSWQLMLYSGGSLLHIVGLAWSGGHGVQRKTAGAAQGLETIADKIPMWVMGLGGVAAVIGGILFLVLTFKSLRTKRTELAS